MYKIQLSNGQTLDNLALNGNNFISASKIEDAVFDGGLSSVTFTDTDTGKSQTYTDMVLIANRVFDGQSWFVLAEKTQEQKEKEAQEKKNFEHEQLINTLLLNSASEFERGYKETTEIQMALAQLFELVAQLQAQHPA